MKKKLITGCLVAFALIFCLGTAASAYTPYDTYTYSINGDALKSPAAYNATSVISSQTMSTADLPVEFGNTLSDICTDERGWVYIVDQTGGQVIVLNQDYRAQFIIKEFLSDNGKGDTFNEPQGVYVSEKYIYVCDTKNSRIVIFELNGDYYKTVTAPENSYFQDTVRAGGEISKAKYTFTPVSCAADRYGRLFVISSGCNQGVIVMDDDSNFTGFIGAQKVSYSLFDMFFRRFESEEERAQRVNNVSVNLNRVALEHGTYGDFIYAVTTNANNEENQKEAITSKSAAYSPVKKLNTKGDEIMKRNGFFDCGGEVNVKQLTTSSEVYGVSQIVDVAVGPEGSWSIVDSKRSKIFTYDSQGQLLFAFGDFSEAYQMGTLTRRCARAIDYQYYPADDTYNLLVLDTDTKTITVFSRTEYGDLLISALANDNARNYSNSINCWLEILGANNNFDAAYIGVGKALYYSGDYDGAMEYLEAAKETDYYALAQSAKSQETITTSPLMLILIVVAVIVLVILFLKLMAYAKRVNYQGNFKSGRRTYWEELMYGFYVSFHPFDGFWDIKHEYRGSVRGGVTILFINVLASYYQVIGRSYLANPTGSYSRFSVQVIAIFIPVLLWAIANWCLTTLFNGEGTFKQVFVATCYATAPLPWFLVLSTVLSNLTSTIGNSLGSFIVVLGYIWVAFLLFFGTLVVQDYSLGKNVITTIGTVVCMAVIMFIVILFASLVGNMVAFISELVTEISYRS